MRVKGAESCPTLCDPMHYPVHGILQTRVLEWGILSLLQVIFPTQGSNPGLLHCRRIPGLKRSSGEGHPLLKLLSIESVISSSYLIFCRPHLLLPSIFPSIRVFSNESVLHIRWPAYWSFSFSISPSNEYSGPISFRMDWLDLLAVQGTLKNLLQHHSSNTREAQEQDEGQWKGKRVRYFG